MFPFKDRVSHLLRSHVVYEISCDACGASYVGKTVQLLTHRLTREMSGRETSAALEHSINEGVGHDFDLKKAKIHSFDKNDKFFEVKESLCIRQFKPALNKNLISTQMKLF